MKKEKGPPHSFLAHQWSLLSMAYQIYPWQPFQSNVIKFLTTLKSLKFQKARGTAQPYIFWQVSQVTQTMTVDHITKFKASLSLNPVTANTHRPLSFTFTYSVFLTEQEFVAISNYSYFSASFNPSSYFLGQIYFPSTLMQVYWSDIRTTNAVILTLTSNSLTIPMQALSLM